MRNGPKVIAWDIHCPSSVASHAVRQLLDREADLDAVVDVTVTSAGTTREEVHRLSDYFEAIHVEPPSPDEPQVVRVVFQRLPTAGRYWRDLMVRLLRSVSKPGDGIAIRMAYRLEDEPAPSHHTERASVG